MPRKDLEQFLRERLTALDPLRDVSSGSRADTEVIQPVLQYFGADLFKTDIRSFALDTLRNVHPDLGVRPDGVIDDTVAKPFSTLAFGVAREIMLLRSRQKADPRIHTLQSAQDLMGALFVPLIEGSKAFGKFRFYYTAPISEIIRPESVIIVSNGMRFVPTETQSISAAEMQLNYEDGKYYFDVDTIATTPGSAGKIPPGTSARCPSVTRSIGVENKQLFVGGEDADTVVSYLSRARNYPTQLSFSVARGIKAILSNEFGSGIKRIEVVGMGDPDMLRDIIRGGNFGPASVFGVGGYALPAFTLDLKSNLFEGDALSDVSIIGSGVLTEDYYLIVHTTSTPSVMGEGRIKSVLRTALPARLELDESVLPDVMQGLVWEIRRRRITLSDVPGGFLLEPPAGSEVEIKDDEIHVGGMTDIYTLGDAEQVSTDIEVASDEDELASGDTAVAGGVATWPNPAGWVRINPPETVLLEENAITIVKDALLRPRGVQLNAIQREVSDLSNIRISPGHRDAEGGSPHSDILEILIAGQWVRYQMVALTSAGGPGSQAVFWTERDILPDPLPVPTPARIVRPSVDGIEDGRSMLVIQRTPPEMYRIVEWRNGFYQGTDNDPANYRAEVRLYPLPDAGSTYPTGESWLLVDDVDVDLSDPKRLRADGPDLVTVSGSNAVTTVIGRNMEEVGVKKDDILRILSGPDKNDYVVAADPSGPGKAVILLQDRLKSPGTVAYEIFSPQTPVTLPLMDVTEANLLDSTAGTTSSVVPLGQPLGAVSSQFSNAGSGIKHRGYNAVVGIVGLFPFTGVYTFTPSGANRLELSLYSKTWGHVEKTLNSGGPYNLALAVDVVQLLSDLNRYLPITYFYAMRPDGSIADPATIVDLEPLYLCVANHDSDEGAEESSKLEAFGTATFFLDAGGTHVTRTTRTITFFDVNIATLGSGISPWNDLVQIENGANSGKAWPILELTSSFGNLHLQLFPWVDLLPQRNTIARIGSPSIGLGRTFFRDPTLFEVSEATRYAAGDLLFAPDVRLWTTKTPGYPETLKPTGLYFDSTFVPGEQWLALPDFYPEYNIEFFDRIVAGCRDIWFLHDFGGGGGAWTPAAGTYEFNFAFENGSTLTVSITTPGAVPYTRTQLETIFNAVLDPGGTSPIAVDIDDGPLQYLGISTQERITSITGNGIVSLGGMEPTTYGTQGNLSYLGQNNSSFFFFLGSPSTPNYIRVTGSTITPPYEDSALANVQFVVQRLGAQRFSAKKISESIHDSGLYYADVELMSLGTGDEWNLGPDVTFEELTGWKALGYSIRPVNEVLSFSVRETPIFSATPYIQDPSVSDGYVDQTPVYGSGLRLNYDRDPTVAAVQTLADSEDERENNESILARCMRPCEVFLTVEYSGGLAETEMRKEIDKLIEAQMDTLDVSEIIYRMQQLGATSVELPIEIGAAFLRQDRTYNLVVAKDRVSVSRLAAFSVGRLTLRRLG